MTYLKLDATDSTNSFLRQLVREGDPDNWTVVSADRQTQGRGQQGTNWFSDSSKNLTFSILIKDTGIRAKDQFLLNCAVSMGIFKVLDSMGIPRLKVKWPNDIMSGTSKLGGILIENSLISDVISYTIAGVGLNVNQERFPENLSSAVSMSMLSGRSYNREDLVMRLVSSIKKEFERIDSGAGEILKRNYENVLYKRNAPHMFRLPGSSPFMGQILGVSDQGQLIIQNEYDIVSHFASKEIEYL